MIYSKDRILTTHVGSLPRPSDLIPLLQAKDDEQPHDAAFLEQSIVAAVDSMVQKQVASGVDIVSDGEMSKLSYTTYITRRLAGMDYVADAAALGGTPGQAGTKGKRGGARQSDMAEHPDYVAQIRESARKIVGAMKFPQCVGALSYENTKPMEQDLKRYRDIVSKHQPIDAFMTAASPGVLSTFIGNNFYNTNDAYLEGLADAMQTEYEAIVDAGFVLQVDCPDLAASNHTVYQDISEDEWLKVIEKHIEVLNHAVRNIPAEKMRMHICWGNYEGPHTHDVAWSKVAPVVFKAKPQAVQFEAANPRHAHEFADFTSNMIPDDKIMIPGVLDSTTNFVEHPKLIAQRIVNWANIVGRERVIAGTDCGFGTFAGPMPRIARSIMWKKFEAMAEGAKIATDLLWA
ncbi:MAG: cobalamin-independent methionine synthase II family protein [Chloroflexota bacterium]